MFPSNSTKYQHLYPIEVSLKGNIIPPSDERNSVNTEDVTEARETRKRRDVAIVGEVRRRMNT